MTKDEELRLLVELEKIDAFSIGYVWIQEYGELGVLNMPAEKMALESLEFETLNGTILFKKNEVQDFFKGHGMLVYSSEPLDKNNVKLT